ncbi:amidohydrolase family protein [Muricauda sp. CAU 1633]|uniref:amidohydrolase family protein n=1 Tax=Allomuricauda sp. CAU 1633 TaxID=2816036 RepID=UPI001A8C3D2C|nr:amidohydrolase family protein [Muricauda sp. CAU 1633]MBO0322227.1 amidohydrolase family protein [Muricauda sp. CAU 1633]
MNKLPLYCFVMILMVACQPKAKEKFDLLIINASVIDVAGGKVLPGKIIGINNDTIQLVANMASADRYESNQIINAKEKFVMPGLWDNHVHFRGGDSLINENKDLLPLFIAHGVTTVRDMGGDISQRVLQWRNEIREGQLTGPNIFTSGPKLDGADPFWVGSIPIGKLEDILPALDSLEDLKVDFVKIYASSLSPELYYRIITACEKRGLKVTGHIPLSADHFKAVELGLDGVEHLFSFLSLASPIGDSLRQQNQGFGMFPQILETYDEDLARDAIAKLASEDFYVTPTLYVSQVIMQLDKMDPTVDSLLPLIGPGIQKTYERRIKQAQNRSPKARQLMLDMDTRERSLVLPMYQAGITILAGSDCGPSNSYVYPGGALHSELALLVETGLTSKEALSTSVISGPKFFGLEEYYGGIEVGKVAHIIMLTENPLVNIENVGSIDLVLKGNTIYDRSKISELKASLKTQ